MPIEAAGAQFEAFPKAAAGLSYICIAQIHETKNGEIEGAALQNSALSRVH